MTRETLPYQQNNTPAGTRKYASKSTRLDLDPQDEFTPQRLSDLLSSKVLKGPKGRQEWALPSPDAIKKLASILNFWRSRFYVAQEGRRLNALITEAERALAVLDKVVPGILENRRARVGEGATLDPFVKWQLDATEKLSLAVLDKDARAYFLHRDGDHEEIQGWKWLARVLPEDFKVAMISTNPNFESGLSASGPVARYVSAIVPFITGDHPTLATVVSRIKEKRKKS
jgi:hypothetical protein